MSNGQNSTSEYKFIFCHCNKVRATLIAFGATAYSIYGVFVFIMMLQSGNSYRWLFLSSIILVCLLWIILFPRVCLIIRSENIVMQFGLTHIIRMSLKRGEIKDVYPLTNMRSSRLIGWESWLLYKKLGWIEFTSSARSDLLIITGTKLTYIISCHNADEVAKRVRELYNVQIGWESVPSPLKVMLQESM